METIAHIAATLAALSFLLMFLAGILFTVAERAISAPTRFARGVRSALAVVIAVCGIGYVGGRVFINWESGVWLGIADKVAAVSLFLGGWRLAARWGAENRGNNQPNWDGALAALVALAAILWSAMSVIDPRHHHWGSALSAGIFSLVLLSGSGTKTLSLAYRWTGAFLFGAAALSFILGRPTPGWAILSVAMTVTVAGLIWLWVDRVVLKSAPQTIPSDHGAASPSGPPGRDG